MANWTKKQPAIIGLALMIGMSVITAKHQEFFCCQERTLSFTENLAVWIGVMEKPAPCPGTEEMYFMAVEMGILSMVIIACTALPTVLKATKSSITCFIFILKKGLSQMKEFIQYRKNTANDVSEEKRPRHINYYVFRNAYKQRKLVMLLRQEDLYEEILLYNSNTRTVKRIA